MKTRENKSSYRLSLRYIHVFVTASFLQGGLPDSGPQSAHKMTCTTYKTYMQWAHSHSRIMAFGKLCNEVSGCLSQD